MVSMFFTNSFGMHEYEVERVQSVQLVPSRVLFMTCSMFCLDDPRFHCQIKAGVKGPLGLLFSFG